MPSGINDLKDKSWIEDFIYFTLIAVFACFYFHEYLNNSFYPLGDGQKYVSFCSLFSVSDTSIPIWNPYDLLGTPTLFSGGRFILLPFLVDTGSELFPFYLNLGILIAIIYFLLSFFVFSREVGLSRPAAFVSTLLVCASGALAQHALRSGRFDTLLSFGIMMNCVHFYLFYLNTKRAKHFFVSALCFGLFFSVTAHYTLTTLVPLFIIFGGIRLREQGMSLKRTWKRIILDGIAITLSGLCFTAILVVPFLWLHATGVHIKTKILFSSLSPMALLNLFFPLQQISDGRLSFSEAANAVHYLPLAAIPVTSLFLLHGVRKNTSKLRILWMAVFVVSTFLIRLDLYPLNRIPAIAGLFPAMRHILPLQDTATIVLGILCASAVDGRINSKESWGWKNSLQQALFIPVLLVVLALLSISHPGEFAEVVSAYISKTAALFHANHQLWLIPACFLVPLGILRSPRNICSAVVTITIIQSMVMKLPEYTGQRFNEEMKEIAKVVNSSDGYFTVFDSAVPERIHYYMPEVRRVNGFSFGMSHEHSNLIRLLTGDDLQYSRPHWNFLVPKHGTNSDLLNLIGVRYAILRPKYIGRSPFNSWKVLYGGQGKKYTLLENPEWKSPIRIYHKWQFLKNEIVPQERITGDTVWLSGEPESNPSSSGREVEFGGEVTSYGTEKTVFTIKSNSPGILVLPEKWAPGWKATVNGSHVQIFKAFGFLRAVQVPAGKSEVGFTYDPIYFRAGLYTSILSIAIFWATVLAVKILRSRKPSKPLNSP